MIEIKPYNAQDCEEDRYVVLVNGLDEIGEHLSLAEAVSAAENEFINYYGYSDLEAEVMVNFLIQDYL